MTTFTTGRGPMMESTNAANDVAMITIGASVVTPHSVVVTKKMWTTRWTGRMTSNEYQGKKVENKAMLAPMVAVMGRMRVLSSDMSLGVDREPVRSRAPASTHGARAMTLSQLLWSGVHREGSPIRAHA